jgi:AcrR family transcriptional regulator
MNNLCIKYELMVHNEVIPEWTQIHAMILELEQAGVVTRTFRRLDPQRQQAIVYAILDEAIEKGPAALNIKQVAERAGVAVGSLYQYFGNRDGLMEFTTRLCVRLLTESFLQYKPILLAMPLREGLCAYLTGGVEWGRMMQGLVQFFGKAAYAGAPEFAEKVVRPVAVAMREMTSEILLAAQARGELRPGIDLEAAARALNAWIIPVADSQLFPYLNLYFQTSDENIPFQRTLEAFLDILAQGLMNAGETK